MTNGQSFFPLKRKLALIVITMSFFAFVVYVPVSYKHAQILLGNQLLERLSSGLEHLVLSSDILNAKPYLVGQHGYIGIIDDQGNIVTPHPRNFANLKDIVHWPETVDQILRNDYARIVFHYKDNSYLVSRPLGEYRLISIAYESDFLDQLNPLIAKSLMVFLIFGGVFAVLAFFFIKGIAGPITKITESTRDIAGKKSFHPVKINTGDELEILASDFNKMSRQIQEYEHGLEQKIATRTEELSEANSQLKEKTSVLEHVLEDVKKVDEQLSRVNKAKTDFLSMASHQLRTPLTAIKWHSKILASGGVKKFKLSQRKSLTRIRQANEHMIQLVNSLLNLSRVEMGTVPVFPEKLDLNLFLKQLLEEVSVLANNKNIAVKFNHPQRAVYAKIDPNLAGVAVMNLLTNAIKYTPDNGKVAMSLSVNKKYARIEVADTGCGIPEKDQMYVFGQFFRGSNTLEASGTGLGLYLTKAIVHLINGEIGFKSKPDKGSVFWINLPKQMKRKQGIKGIIWKT